MTEGQEMNGNLLNIDIDLVYRLIEIFPEACPTYIRMICVGKTNEPGMLDNLISVILDQDEYPKRQKSPEKKMEADEQLSMLQQIFPDADPSYLQIQCDALVNKPEDLSAFTTDLLETGNYPTMKDYLRKQQISAQQRQYTTEFNVENFVKVIPDPAEYFWDPKRKGTLVDDESVHYAICFLRNHFRRLPMLLIRKILKQHDSDFLAVYEELKKVKHRSFLKKNRATCEIPQLIQNVPLLQEIAYIEHREEIKKYIKFKKVKEDQERIAAEKAGLLQTCFCCFDTKVMPKEIYKCEKGCAFCKDCVRKGCEVAFGNGKLDFLCLENCSSHFSLKTLQDVLHPKMFLKIAQKKQVEEVKTAGISDLETCPFCDFMIIPVREDKLFHCLNPECMKESCRLCKEPSHLPLRCDQVEKEEDIKFRTYIEDRMTEALLRKCYKCGMKFIKADGCNKMTCSCGASMCYICNQPVKDYKHFNGLGGDRFDLCPLFNDTNDFHEKAVLKEAEAAKKELGVDKNPSKLKVDPTADVVKYYDEVKKKNPIVIPPYRNPPPFVPIGFELVFAGNVHGNIQQRAVQQDHRHHYHHQHNPR